MFIRSVWQLGRALNLPQILSEMGAPTDHTSGYLGLYHHEFALAKTGNNDFGSGPTSKTNG